MGRRVLLRHGAASAKPPVGQQMIHVRLRYRLATLLLTVTVASLLVGTVCIYSTRRSVLSGEEHTAVDPSPDDWRVILRSNELKTLNVMAFDAGTVSNRHFERIHNLRNLNTLMIASASVTDDALDHIATHPQIKAIVMYDCRITDSGLLKLTTAKNLQTVGLAHTEVTETGIRDAMRLMPTVHFELYDPSRYGEVFDESGCLSIRFLKRHCGT